MRYDSSVGVVWSNRWTRHIGWLVTYGAPSGWDEYWCGLSGVSRFYCLTQPALFEALIGVGVIV